MAKKTEIIPMATTEIIPSPKTEIIPSPARIHQAEIDLPNLKEQFEKLVEAKVAEIMAAREDFVFEPFFQSRELAYEIRRLQTVSDQKKWSVFFEEEGCQRCGCRDKLHGGKGYCTACYQTMRAKLKAIERRLMNEG